MVKSKLLLWLFALALIAGFSSLGRWQLHRAAEKQSLLDQQTQLLATSAPQSLAELSRQSETRLASVEGRGRFADAPALLLDNQRRGDAVGVHVYRVFQPFGGRALLVDLGWLQLPPDRKLPTLTPISGEQLVSGLLTPPPSSGLALGPAYSQATPQQWLLTRVDLAALSQALHVDLAPRVLRLDPKLPIGYPRDLNLLTNTLPPERHRGYAVQWFGLALATLITALFLTFRRRP
ncbi:MAG TPA: SURF1 family protein [Luteimonas sp.]|nr:SURF1 family protein [Luteimonas sp.]